MPPKPAPVHVKSTTLQRNINEPTGYIIESSKLEPEFEIKGTPVIPKPAPEPVKTVNLKTQKIE